MEILQGMDILISQTHKVIPEIKGFHSPDVVEWYDGGRPDNSHRFTLLLQISIGQKGTTGSDIFDILVKASPDYPVASPRFCAEEHALIVERFDKSDIEQVISEYVSTCSGNTWEEVAKKIGAVAKWEFDGYQPYEEVI